MPIYLSANSSRLSTEISRLPESVNAKLDRMSRKLSKCTTKKSAIGLLRNQSGASNLFNDPPTNLISLSTTSSSSDRSASSSCVSNSSGINNIDIELNDSEDHHSDIRNERLRAGKNIKTIHKISIKKPNTMKRQNPKINQVIKRKMVKEAAPKPPRQVKRKITKTKKTTKEEILKIMEKAHLEKGYNAVSSEYLNKFLIGLFKDSYPNVIKRVKTYQNYWKEQMNQRLANDNICLYKEYLLPYRNNELLKNCIKTIKENESTKTKTFSHENNQATPKKFSEEITLNGGDEELLNAIQKQYLKALVM